MPYGATQNRRVVVERSDRMWSTGEGNGKPLQYSCLDNPMNSRKRQNDRILKEELPRSVGAQYVSGEIKWDGWMASLTQWMRVWVNSGSWWWTGRPGVLWFMGSQRVGRDWATELNWTKLMELAFQVPMQYCCLQHQTLLLSPVISTTGYFALAPSLHSFWSYFSIDLQ